MLEQEIEEIRTLQRLKKLGIKVVAFKPRFRFAQRQTYSYDVARKGERGMEIIQLPKDHYIEHDYANKRVRLLGRFVSKSGKGAWLDIKRKQTVFRDDSDDYLTFQDTLYQESLPDEFQLKEKLKIIIAKGEIPFMKTYDHKIVCIPNNEDALKWGAIGMTGCGKTTVCHSLMDRIVHIRKEPFLIMNDEQRENTTYVMPNAEASSELDQLGNHPLGSPCVYLYQTTDDLRDDQIDYKDELGFKISMSFIELFKNWVYYMKDLDEWMIPPKSKNVFENLQGKITGCKNVSDIMKVLDTDPELNVDKGVEMKKAILRVLNNILNSKILDISSGEEAYWEVAIDGKKWEKLNPVLACLYCGLCPVIESHTFNSKPYLPQIMKYWADSVEKAMLGNSLFKNISVNVYVDEITNIICSNNLAKPVFERFAAQGRQKRIGFGWAAQTPKLLTKIIWRNTNYLFIFQLVDEAEAKSIIKNYPEIPKKETVTDILSLNKFEFVACTKQHYVAYDLHTGEKEEGKYYKGIVLPPLSRHKRPKEVG